MQVGKVVHGPISTASPGRLPGTTRGHAQGATKYGHDLLVVQEGYGSTVRRVSQLGRTATQLHKMGPEKSAIRLRAGTALHTAGMGVVVDIEGNDPTLPSADEDTLIPPALVSFPR